MEDIKQWDEIKDRFSDTILLGNGSSIAIHDCFKYKSLVDFAAQDMAQEVKDIFLEFKVYDFEYVLRTLSNAIFINNKFKIKDSYKLESAYLEVQNSLIKTVSKIHPEYESVELKLKHFVKLLSRFDTVLSLNYDLMLYWGILDWNEKEENKETEHHKFKDCFVYQKFRTDWQTFRYCINRENKVTLVFYPHGNLILVRHILSGEWKVGRDDDINLLGKISLYWGDYHINPLFISEGYSLQKKKSIQSSPYLATVYYEVLPSLQESLVIYGWGMSDNDEHILRALSKSNIERIAISVHKKNTEFMKRAESKITEILRKDIEITFFDAESLRFF